MRPAKYIVLCILWLGFVQGICAQNKNKIPAAVATIFDDLPIDDPSKNSVLKPGEDSIQKIKKNIFIKGVISKTHCYLGEPVLLNYTLFSALQSTSSISRAPSFAGFSVTAIDTGNEAVNSKKINGKTYRLFIIQQVQLVPLQEGVLIIDPISVYNEVNYKENEKDFRYSGPADEKAITINVDPLPVVGRPDDFTGATGNFTISVRADTTIAAGENNTLHIEIGGSGNFTAISIPEITWPADCEHFSVNNHLQIDKNSFPPSGEKIFDIPFVIAKEGLAVVPAMRLSFFDTQKKIYRSIYSNTLTIHVSPALGKPVNNVSVLPDKKISAFYYLLAAGIFVLLVAAIFLYRRKGNTETVTEAVAAEPVIIPSPKKIIIEGQLETLNAFDNTTDYITALKKLLTDHLQQQAGILPGTEEALLQQLQIKDADVAAEAAQFYSECNGLLYSPGKIDVYTKTAMENKLVAVCNRVNLIFV